MKKSFIRFVWKIVTFFYRVKPPGKGRVSYPSWVKVFINEAPPRQVVEDMADTYTEIFTDPMWGETWTKEEAIAKFVKEVNPSRPSFLCVVEGDEKNPVGGLCWGALIPVEKVEKEAFSALGVKPEGLEETLRKRGIKHLLYFHEVALLPRFRKGPEPVKFLVRPGLELAFDHGVKANMFWSSPESKIVPLTKLLGYETIFRTQNEHGAEIVFLFNPNGAANLKSAQNFTGKYFSVIFKFFSRIFRKISGKK